MAGANLGARLMTTSKGLNWLSSASFAPAKELPMHIARLNTMAQNSQDPELVEAIDALNSALLLELRKEDKQ
jgi:hypothetical protein